MRNIFLFILWERARIFEKEMTEKIRSRFTVLRDLEFSWPRRDWVDMLKNFYRFGSSFCWWNKARKCGRGPFRVLVVEDSHPVWKAATDMRGQRLLADINVVQLKHELRKLSRHSNVVHSSITPQETDQQLRALFGLGTAEFLAWDAKKYAMPLIGRGSRRACLRLEGTGKCLKCYRADDDLEYVYWPGGGKSPLDSAVRNEVKAFRFDRKRNICAREFACYRELRRRLPKDLADVFPDEAYEVCHPEFGWGMVETEIKNFDGSPIVPFAQAYAECAGEKERDRLVDAFLALGEQFAAHSVRFYDPPNVMVQKTGADGGFRLRIVDFEPTGRTLIPVDRMLPVLARMKVRRRFVRFLKEQLGVSR